MSEFHKLITCPECGALKLDVITMKCGCCHRTIKFGTESKAVIPEATFEKKQIAEFQQRSETMSEFREKLKTATSIKCNHQAAMAGNLLYHILAIFDDEVVAVKYLGGNEPWLHYAFYGIGGLYRFYLNGWIELRGEA